MARSQATIIFAAALVVNVLLLSQSRLTNLAVQQHDVQDFGTVTSLFRRGLVATDPEAPGENVRPYSSSDFLKSCRLLNALIVLVRPVLRRTLNSLTSSV